MRRWNQKKCSTYTPMQSSEHCVSRSSGHCVALSSSGGRAKAVRRGWREFKLVLQSRAGAGFRIISSGGKLSALLVRVLRTSSTLEHRYFCIAQPRIPSTRPRLKADHRSETIRLCKASPGRQRASLAAIAWRLVCSATGQAFFSDEPDRAIAQG